jgi:pentatricopeptide repeat protein
MQFYFVAKNKNPGFLYLPPRLAVYYTPKFPTRLVQEYINQETSSSLREAWEKISVARRVRLWPQLMITALKDCPEKAMKILSATYVDPYPDGKAFSDCLNFIIWYYLRYTEPSDDTPALKLFRTISRLLLEGPSDHVYLSQTSIFLLMAHLRTPDWIEKLYRTMDKINNPLHHNTLMQFVDRLAKAGGQYTNIAYEIIENIGCLQGVDFNTPNMRSICTTLLMAAGPNTKFDYMEVFGFVLKCGLKPDIIIYNVLIYKTVKAGKHNRGWQIYETMKEDYIEPDSYTYSILLNDAKKRMDRDAISRVTNAVRERSLWSTHVVTDALHAMFLLHMRNHQAELKHANRTGRSPRSHELTYFEQMLPVYCEYFHFGPLACLIPELAGIYKHITKSDSIPIQKDELVEPQNPVLVVMLSALLRSYNDPDTPKIFYDHFRKLVQNNDPMVVQLSDHQGDFGFRTIYNLTLLALGNHASRIPECLQILGDMTAKAPDPPDTGDPDIYEPPPLHPPKPDISTWSVLVSIFQKHRQTRAAEKVLEMMKERGIEPNRVTWGSLLNGYAKMQETQMVVDVLDRLDKAGYAADSFAGSLRMIRDRRALVDGLQKLEEERAAKEIRQVETIREEVEGANAEAEATEENAENATDGEDDGTVVKDMVTRNAYKDLNRSNTQWRVLKFFQRIDDGIDEGTGGVDEEAKPESAPSQAIPPWGASFDAPDGDVAPPGA